MIDVFIATCLAGILIPFVLYPFVLWLHALLAPAPVEADDVTPKVDLLIAAHDERPLSRWVHRCVHLERGGMRDG